MKDRRRIFKKRTRRLLVKSILIPKMKNVKCPGSKSKVNDKNRFILIKEIVEINKIVEMSKYYLKSNVPSTVDVLRAGK